MRQGETRLGRHQPPAVPQALFPIREPKLEYGDIENAKFENVGRIYTLDDGTKYPSITTVLGKLPKDGLDAWRDRVGHAEADRIMKRAARRGTAVHDAIEFWLKGISPTFTNLIAQQAFHKIAKVLGNTLIEVWALESAMYSTSLRCAGRADLIANVVGLGGAVVDFKTSNNPKTADFIFKYFMQAAFYSQCWLELTGEDCPWLVIIIAVDTEPEAQIFVERRENWIGRVKEAIDVVWSDPVAQEVLAA
jgi:genome maintenance exonuclease 1